MKLLVPPPVVALICVVLVWFAARSLPAANFDFGLRVHLALLICVVGAIINFIAVGLFVRKKTTISPVAPQNAEALVVTGIYRFTRNPMYLGMALLIAAIGMWLGNYMLIPAVILFVWYITRFQIKPEEAVLREKFGEPYDEYRNQARRWI